MISSTQTEKKSELERAVKIAQQLEQSKFKGELTLMFDGSGKVAKIKQSEFV